MKKFKKILAGMAAAVMAFSTMSVGASADDYTASWNTLRYSDGMPSNYIVLDSYATVKARVTDATLSVNVTINKTGNTPYMHASAYNADNAQLIYNSGSYHIYFSNGNLPKGSYKTVYVELGGYSGNYISASGNVSN